ncbi:lytic transglycosylase domain-containing protein, partial [Candidatus Bipolaricaulota bacterium]|nr:lytic transglycosylase domain-containing protein [Candidatus Bipolaricaulota bacterium]
ETLVRYREYRRARGLLLRYIGDLSRELKPGAYFRLAWLDGVKLDFPEEALWTFQRLFRTALSRSMEAKGRYYFALTKNGVEDDYNLTNNLLEVHERFPDTYFGKLAARRAFEEETEDADLTTLDRALERYRSRLTRRAVRSATWRLFFKSYEAGSYRLALDYLGLVESYYENVPPKFLFWRRKARIASPDVEQGSYLRVMTFQENHPTDYYSLLAGQKGWSRDNFRVSETWSSREIGPAQVEQRVLEGDIPTSTLAQFELAISLEEHGLVTLALNRLERLAANIPKEDYLYLKFQWERSAGNYRESLKTAVELMDWYYDNNRRPPVEVVKAAYPTYFSDAVERSAGKFGLPEELIYGVIRQESAFDRDAYSTAKAGGLMQVIPSTARGIANDLGDTDFQFDDLFDPQTAVEFGSYYVNKQVSGSGNIRLGLVAYHGGPGNLSRWREDIGVGDVDLFLERIPQGSTENYVKAVYRNYLVYRQLY